MKIKAIRKKTGMTQVELADALCVGQSTIATWETNRAMPRADKLKPLAQALGCTVDELLDGADDAERKE